MAFLEKLDRFYGTGECNRAGESLEAFLEKYNPKNMIVQAIRWIW